MELPMNPDLLMSTEREIRRRAQILAARHRELGAGGTRRSGAWTLEGCRMLGDALVQMGSRLRHYASRQAA